MANRPIGQYNHTEGEVKCLRLPIGELSLAYISCPELSMRTQACRTPFLPLQLILV